MIRTSMQPRIMIRVLSFSIIFLLASSTLAAKVLDKTAEVSGMTVHYKVALPKDYDPQKTYPAVLAFPSGAQTMDMVLTTLMQNWRMEGDRRGYIVVLPATPEGRPFVGQGAKIFPEFIEMLLREYKIRDNKFSCCRHVERRPKRFPNRSQLPAIFPLGDWASRISSGPDTRTRRGAVEFVHLHARGRVRHRLASADGATGVSIPEQRLCSAFHYRKRRGACHAYTRRGTFSASL